MSILAQHGWGKTDKIERGLQDGSIQGIIASPRDEIPDNLRHFLTAIASNHPETERFVDPLFHIGMLPSPSDGQLWKYDHYHRGLNYLSFSPADIGRYVAETLDWQGELDVTKFVSPTVMVDDLSGRWSQIAMNLAQEALQQHDGSKPILISVVVDEEALTQRNIVDAWLDEITLLDTDGFYMVVRRSSDTNNQQFHPEILASLLKVCYSLAAVNEYSVFVGYSDFVTMLLHSVGVEGTGAGWSAGLKKFTLRRFTPATFGRQARSRYASLPLLNSIYITELDGIYAAGRVSDVLSNSSYDARFSGPNNPENVPWPNDESALHHWAALSEIANAHTGGHLSDRLDLAQNQIAYAQMLYSQFARLVLFRNETGPMHLDQWSDALDRFRADAGV